MKGIQIIGILVALYLILQTLIQYKKGNYGLKRTCFWLSLWGLIGSLFAFPSLVGLTLPFFAMQDMVLTTLVVGLILVFVLVYHTYQQVTRVERKLTELVQNIAIQDYIENATADPKGKDDER